MDRRLAAGPRARYRLEAARRQGIPTVTDPAAHPEPAPPVPGGIATLCAELGAALRFFSRLPVPRLGPADDPAAPPRFATVARVIPLAGAVLGVPGALIVGLGALAHLPAGVSAVFAVALLVAVTGAFHEDGLADTADGFGGGWSRARKLEIMKDSRLGSYGAAALVLVLLARITLLAALIEQNALVAALALVAAGAVARGAALALVSSLPSARADGVAAAAGRPERASLLLGSALATALALMLIGPVAGVGAALVATAAAFAAAAGVGRLALAQIGGQTGDVAGAAEQAGEVAFALALLIVLSV